MSDYNLMYFIKCLNQQSILTGLSVSVWNWKKSTTIDGEDDYHLRVDENIVYPCSVEFYSRQIIISMINEAFKLDKLFVLTILKTFVEMMKRWVVEFWQISSVFGTMGIHMMRPIFLQINVMLNEVRLIQPEVCKMNYFKP